MTRVGWLYSSILSSAIANSVSARLRRFFSLIRASRASELTSGFDSYLAMGACSGGLIKGSWRREAPASEAAAIRGNTECILAYFDAN